ncbi:hypothetical protein J2Y58_002981 [Sphingomonas sp. BE138]|nr:hypothetical protein [Sphingomonas sp. BE138]MDR6789608.1 hypothetical protein [Sphingomonas sp. BE138]
MCVDKLGARPDEDTGGVDIGRAATDALDVPRFVIPAKAGIQSR